MKKYRGLRRSFVLLFKNGYLRRMMTTFCYHLQDTERLEGPLVYEVHFASSPPIEKLSFLYGIRVCFVCAENFFVCAQLEQKLFKKQIFKVSGMLEK